MASGVMARSAAGEVRAGGAAPRARRSAAVSMGGVRSALAPGGSSTGGREGRLDTTSGRAKDCPVPAGGPRRGGVGAALPVLLSGPEVTLSPEAMRLGVEGTLLVRCLITAAGAVEGCEVLKGLPVAEAAVLAALQARRYRPAEVAGRPVSVRHLFSVRIARAR